MCILLALAVSFLWGWVFVKTWSFLVKNFEEETSGKVGVIYGFFGGLLWPLTYTILILLLISNVLFDYSLQEALNDLRCAWRK